MSFQPHKLPEDKLESIYLENIEKIKKYDYSSIGLTDFTISESNMSLLLNNFRKYKIIGFNIGKFGDFVGAQPSYAPPGACNFFYTSSEYFSFFIYIIYVDTIGNCYGQIQSEKVNSNSYEYFKCGCSTIKIDWNSELFVKPFSIPQKSIDITTDFDLIMKCISKNRVLEYSYPEYKEVYKSYIGPCDKKYQLRNIQHGPNSASGKGFSNLIGITMFKNIGNKCNEIKRCKIEKKQKIELEKKLLEDKRIEEERKKLEKEQKKLEEERIFCREKVNSLKPKYGDKIYYKFDEKNKQILYIGYSNSEIIDLSDFIEYTTKKNIFRGRIIETKIGNIEKIVFNNCANLRRIYDFVEGLVTISINNCPNISEIDCYDKIKKIWIDKECISIKTKIVSSLIPEFPKIKPVIVEEPKVAQDYDKKASAPDYLIDSAFSCEIMEDPVIASDGITYNRREIEEWFKNHDTSPKTGEILKSKGLIPNISIRNAIEEWKKRNS